MFVSFLVTFYGKIRTHKCALIFFVAKIVSGLIHLCDCGGNKKKEKLGIFFAQKSIIIFDLKIHVAYKEKIMGW